MRRSHNNYFANQIIDNLISAAESCDPVALNDFFSIAVESNLNHLDLIADHISGVDCLKRTNAILAGSILLGLFNHFASRKLRDRLRADKVYPG